MKIPNFYYPKSDEFKIPISIIEDTNSTLKYLATNLIHISPQLSSISPGTLINGSLDITIVVQAHIPIMVGESLMRLHQIFRFIFQGFVDHVVSQLQDVLPLGNHLTPVVMSIWCGSSGHNNLGIQEFIG